MRVVVIGGTAFLGPAVIEHLTAEGHEVQVFHRGSTPAILPDGIQELLGDRRDLYQFRQQFAEFAPDAVIDMVCMTEHHARQTADTFEGIANRLVIISSQDVYRAFGRAHGSESGPPDPVPLSEDAPLREKLYLHRDAPNQAFEWSRDYEKIMVEKVAQSEPELPATVIRLPAVYGPGDYQHRLFGYAIRMADNRPAILLNERMAKFRWTRGYVHNIASAVTLAAGDPRAAGRTYNVGEPYAFSELEWVKRIGQVMDWDGKIVVVSGETLDVGLNTDQHWVTNTSKIRQELGFEEPVPLTHALEHTLEWELANPPEGYRPSGHQYEAEDEILTKAGLM